MPAPVTKTPIPVLQNAVDSNKVWMAASAAAVTLATLALSKDPETLVNSVKTLSGIVLDNSKLVYDFAKESDIAKGLAMQMLIEKVGINKIIDTFADSISLNDQVKFRELKTISNWKADKLKKFFSKIVGGTFMSVDDIKTADKNVLENKYKRLRPNLSIEQIKRFSKANLQEMVYEAQLENHKKVTAFLSAIIGNSLKVATASVVLKVSKSIYSSVTEINNELSKLEALQSQKDMPMNIDDPELLKQASKATAQKLKDDFRTKQKDIEISSQKDVHMKIDDPELLKQASKASSQKLKDDFRMQQKKAGIPLNIDDPNLLKEASKAAAQKLKTEFRLAQAKAFEEAELLKVQQQADTEFVKARRELKIQQNKLKNDIKNAATLEKLANEFNVVIVNPDGSSHGLPPENVIMDERIQNELSKMEFTPLAQKLTQEAVKLSTHWIPGIGWIQTGIDRVNLGLDIAEQAKKIGRIVQMITDLNSGIEIQSESENMQTVGNLLKMRVPGLKEAVGTLYETDTLNAKIVVMRAMKDKILNGWDDATFARELAKKFLGTEDLGVDTAVKIGETIMGIFSKSAS